MRARALVDEVLATVATPAGDDNGRARADRRRRRRRLRRGRRHELAARWRAAPRVIGPGRRPSRAAPWRPPRPSTRRCAALTAEQAPPDGGSTRAPGARTIDPECAADGAAAAASSCKVIARQEPKVAGARQPTAPQEGSPCLPPGRATADPRHRPERGRRADAGTEHGELVAAARRREPEAWAELVARYGGMVRGVVASLPPAGGGRRGRDADDLVAGLRAAGQRCATRTGWAAGWPPSPNRECLALLRRARWETPDETVAEDVRSAGRARRRRCWSRRPGARCGRPWPR